MATRMLQRRGTAAEWAAANPILASGEIGFETDTKLMKMGDGVTAWNDLLLPYVMTGGATMTGPLELIAPTGPAHAARKQDVDAVQSIAAALPQGLLVPPAEVTTDQGNITSEVDLTGLSVTISVPANRYVHLKGRIQWFSSLSGSRGFLMLKEGTTDLQYASGSNTGTSANASTAFSLTIDRTLVPSAGQHTYRLAMLNATPDGGVLTMRATTERVAYLQAEDMGSAV